MATRSHANSCLKDPVVRNHCNKEKDTNTLFGVFVTMVPLIDVGKKKGAAAKAASGLFERYRVVHSLVMMNRGFISKLL